MPKLIMLVDDEPDVMRVCDFRLKRAGYEVINAANGQEAIDLLQKNKPDLIFLDLRLPIINGSEVSVRVKSDPSTKNIPVVLFTASADGIEDRVKDYLADDYLIKPFEPEILFQKVRKFLGDTV